MINGISLKNSIISASNNIQLHKEEINDLNIFPVPDGDTGTNMSLTIEAAAKALENCNSRSASEVLKATAGAMLRGARGNSGVILSILFRGISDGIGDAADLDAPTLMNALGLGVDKAYEAVMNPAEGTILTVAKRAQEAGKAAADTDSDPIIALSTACTAAQEALIQTPEQLPILKKAGVVDAGGKGLCVILEGMVSLLRDGVMIEPEDVSYTDTVLSTTDDDFFKKAAIEFDNDIRYTYCTEFIIGRNKDCAESPSELRAALEMMGDCVVVAEDSDIIKVHVHTETPGTALEKGLAFGQLLTVKIENMKEQNRHEALKRQKNPEVQEQKEIPEPVEPVEDIGFVAVASGKGLCEIFKDLGCVQVVNGGQSMNPSTDDILNAIMATPSKMIFVFPNNKNIIMAAEQAASMVKGREIVVVPTRTIPQGLSALLAYDADATPELNHEAMLAAAKAVKTGQITYAARNSEFGITKFKEGEIIALEDGKPKFCDKDPVRAAIKLTKEMINRDTTFITIIYGQGITETQAQQVMTSIRAKAGENIEITMVSGDQPIYYFIISVE